MTSANGGNYAGKYRREGWFHNLDLTLFINTTTYALFLIQGDSLKKTINYSRHKDVLK